MNSTKKLAKLLRTSEEVVKNIEKKMSQLTGKENIVDELIEENNQLAKDSLQKMGLDNFSKAEDVYNALQEKTQQDNNNLLDHFHRPNFSTTAGCNSLINATKELTGSPRGLFLKEESAKNLLKANPPKNIMAYLGYGSDVEKMLQKEDIFKIFSALRFAEESHWLNQTFLNSYTQLTIDDFEERKIKVLVLPEKWAGIGEKFLGRKLHPMSHLKELGVVFVIPVEHDFPIKALYLFFMTLHYIHEVDWHSHLFQRYSQESDFTKKMVDILRVEAGMENLPNDKKMSWRLLPKYLAKSHPDDPRLQEPHIDTESLHYYYVSGAINNFSRRFPSSDLDFWVGLNEVEEVFSDKDKQEALVSFNLFDNGISALKNMSFSSRYYYHQQEALWNKFFSKYIGVEEMNELMMNNLGKGLVVFDL